MAYQYPANENASTSSLVRVGSTATHVSGRKGGDASDVLREFKSKIEEDEAYLSFFNDRIAAEETYIRALSRLQQRALAVDTLREDAFPKQPKTTIQKAWEEVRDHTQREIEARQAMVGAMREDVTRDLFKLKEEQSRIRQNLKDNMKLSEQMYEEHARIQLPKLKRTYWQRCQALEDHKRQEHAIQMQAKLLSTSNNSPPTTPLHDHPNAWTSTTALSPPTSTGALPPMSNPSASEIGHSHTPSASVSFPTNLTSPIKSGNLANRSRAGSASGGGDRKDTKEVIADIAQQSKKGLNALMSKLGGDKGDKEDKKDDEAVQPGMPRRLSGSRGDPTRGMGTMKGVRVKREADEADKAYRLGVFHLESLRLRREKVRVSAIKNLDALNDELNKKLQRALGSYIDVLHATSATTAQTIEMARISLDEVNEDRDLSIYRSTLSHFEKPQLLPVPYHNYYVGECRSLIFGISLTDYDFARGEGGDRGRPPSILEKCITALDERGLEAEGIYRISGRHAGVQKMVQDIERDEEKFQFDDKEDVYAISNVLKQYLRELPEPVFHLPHAERVKHTENRETHISSNFSALRGRIRRLPPIHQTTLHAVLEHLSKVHARREINKMDAKNLAVVFNTVLFGQDQASVGNILAMHLEKDTVLEDMISNADLFFSGEDGLPAPGILPAGSGLSRSGVISYHPVDDGAAPGSSRTKFQLLDPALPPVEPPSAPAIDLTRSGSSTSSSDLLETPIAPSREGAKGILDGPSILPPPSFTPDEQLDLLFDPALIPDSMRQAVPDELHVRPLAATDFMRSLFGLLQTLTASPPIAPSVFGHIFQHLQSCGETYLVVVMVSRTTDQLMAHGTVVVEDKFIHGGSKVGHVEDIVISRDMQGKGLGQILIKGLTDMAIAQGVYKTQLTCNETKVGFYEKCGFHRRSVLMAYLTPGANLTPGVTPQMNATVPLPNPAGPSGNTLAVPPVLQRRPYSPSAESDHPESEATTGLSIIVPHEQYPSESSPGDDSESNASGITYHYPLDAVAGASGMTDSSGSAEAAAPVVSQWANEGLGASEVKHSPGRSGSGDRAVSGRDHKTGRISPLPPGAAQPELAEEPKSAARTDL